MNEKPDFSLPLTILDASGSPPKISTKQQFLCWKFIGSKAAQLEGRWGAEIRMANFLLQGYPDWEFWRNLNLGFWLNSLTWFATDKGRKFTKANWQHWQIHRMSHYEVQDKPVVKLKPSKQEPQTILDLLD